VLVARDAWAKAKGGLDRPGGAGLANRQTRDQRNPVVALIGLTSLVAARCRSLIIDAKMLVPQESRTGETSAWSGAFSRNRDGGTSCSLS
jgi:hypothetical protein